MVDSGHSEVERGSAAQRKAATISLAVRRLPRISSETTWLNTRLLAVSYPRFPNEQPLPRGGGEYAK